MRMGPLLETTPTGASAGVLPDVDSLALAAATVIVAEARRAVKQRGRFSLALSGGATPEPVYRLLAAPPFRELMPWAETEVFWGDERCVDVSDPRSNERMARQALLGHVPLRPEQVHPMRCPPRPGGGAAEVPHGEAAARRAADDYEVLLRKRFGGGSAGRGAGRGPGARGCGTRLSVGGGLDLALMGVGDNAHTASLFPGAPELDERERWAVAAFEDPGTAQATSGTGERLWRVTLTAPFINWSRLVLFVVSGAAKAEVVNAALRGEGDPHEMPVLLIRPEGGRQWWLVDDTAAAALPAAGRPGGRWEGAAAAAGAGGIESFDDLPECEGGPSR